MLSPCSNNAITMAVSLAVGGEYVCLGAAGWYVCGGSFRFESSTNAKETKGGARRYEYPPHLFDPPVEHHDRSAKGVLGCGAVGFCRAAMLPPAAALLPWAVAGAALLAAHARLALHHDDPLQAGPATTRSCANSLRAVCTMWCCCATIPALSPPLQSSPQPSPAPRMPLLPSSPPSPPWLPQAVETPPPRVGQCCTRRPKRRVRVGRF